jgi:uncharacterized SAM-binding protein YcdF (DUF218 family)
VIKSILVSEHRKKQEIIFAKFVITLISPLGSALALGLFACLLGALGRRRLALVLSLAAFLWLNVWSLPVASLWIRATLEGEYPATAIPALPAVQAVVVIGGAIAPAQAGHLDPNLGAAADRVWHAARLYHAGKAPLLVLSGGTDPKVSLTSEAEAMRMLLRDLGVPDAAMLLEGKSRTTEENARFSADLLRQRGIKTVLLVTSALHMKRALRHWEGQGLLVHPAATDHEASLVPSSWQLWLPNASALDGSTRALKEWIGDYWIAKSRSVHGAAAAL